VDAPPKGGITGIPESIWLLVDSGCYVGPLLRCSGVDMFKHVTCLVALAEQFVAFDNRDEMKHVFIAKTR
jgi:hypothetical protein